MSSQPQDINLIGNTPNTPRVNFAGKYPRTDDTGGVIEYFALKGSIFFVIDSNSPTSTTSPLLYFYQYPGNNPDQQACVTLNLQLSQYYCAVQGYQFHRHFNIFISGDPDQPNSANTLLNVYQDFPEISNPDYLTPVEIEWGNSITYNFSINRFEVKLAGSFTDKVKSVFKGIYHIY